MKICFPIQNDAGMDSFIYGHLSSAPQYLILNTETGSLAVIGNEQQQAKGCNLHAALSGRHVDAIVVSGVGAGAFDKLHAMGLKVLRVQANTVRENVALLCAGELPEFTPLDQDGDDGSPDC